MVKPLPKKKQQDVLALLHKDCSLREITKTMDVYKFSKQRLYKKHFTHKNLSVGDKPRKLTSARQSLV